VKATIEERFGPTHGVHALTFAAARAGVAELVRSAFAICHALVLIALVVSFVGVLNFLLAAVLDRGPELRVLGALGVSARQLTATITSEGAIIGGVGAAIGLVAGVVMSRLIVLHSVPMVNGWHFTWRFPVATAALLGTMVIALSAAAGLLPARLATRRVRAREVVE
jgi:putative ABC transport system permease protein